jgi:hypothetical protein
MADRFSVNFSIDGTIVKRILAANGNTDGPTCHIWLSWLRCRGGQRACDRAIGQAKFVGESTKQFCLIRTDKLQKGHKSYHLPEPCQTERNPSLPNRELEDVVKLTSLNSPHSQTPAEGSVGVEKPAKVIRGDVPAGLPENGMAGSGVKLAMVGNGQSLLFSRRADPSQFDVTPRLLKNCKSEALKYRNGVRPRQPPQFRHRPARLPS